MWSRTPVLVVLLFILLLIVPAQATLQDMVNNGNFDDGLSGWYKGTPNYGSGGSPGHISDLLSGGHPGACAQLYVDGGDSGWSNIQLSQTIDLTGVDDLDLCTYMDFDNNGGTSTQRFQVLIDGKVKLTHYNGYRSWEDSTIDVSGYSGDHTVSFYVSTSNGGQVWLKLDNVMALAYFKDPVINGVGATPLQGEAPLKVDFIAGVTPGIPSTTNYDWDFGDYSGHSFVQNPSHTYEEAGTYTATLECFNSKTQQPYPSKSVTVTVSATPESSVKFDKTRYLSAESAAVDAHVKTPDFQSKTYNLELRSFNQEVVGDLLKTWPVTQDDTTISIPVGDYDPGNYVIFLVENNAGIETRLAYGTADFSYAAVYHGKTYDAESNTAISGVTVTYTQLGQAYSDVSDEDGNYRLIGFSCDLPGTFSATKTGYSFVDFSATPLSTKDYTKDLYLLPTSPAHSGTAIAGMVIDDITHQVVPGATVSLSGTSSHTTTSSGSGYYIFEGLSAGTYDLYAAKDDLQSPSVSVETSLGDVEIQNLYIKLGHTVTITVKDKEGVLCPSADVVLVKDGIERYKGTTGSDGKAVITAVESGEYNLISIVKDIRTQQILVVDSDVSVDVSLPTTAAGSGGSGMQYPPHNVQFVVKSLWGAPIEGVDVSVAPIESNGPSGWLEDWLGISSDVDVLGTTMHGSTGSDGSISFMMIQNVKYRLTFAKDGETLTEMDITPSGTYYDVVAGGGNPWKPGKDPHEIIKVDITQDPFSSSQARIYVHYDDSDRQTTHLKINLTHASEPVDSFFVTGESNVNTSFIVDDFSGQEYGLDIIADHQEFGIVERTYVVSFGGKLVQIPGCPDWAYTYISIFGLVLLGLLFGASSVEEGTIAICILGWIFTGMGWMSELGSAGIVGLIFATVIATVWNLIKWKRRGAY